MSPHPAPECVLDGEVDQGEKATLVETGRAESRDRRREVALETVQDHGLIVPRS